MSEMVQRGSKYSDEDRRRAVLEYALSGSITKVAKSMGIPKRTLNDWKKTDWWDELTAKVRHEKNDQILAAEEQILELALRELVDRLENGDTQLVRTKDGIQMHKVPVKAKELAIIGGVSFDKRQIGLNQPTSIAGKDTGKNMVEFLEKLAVTFQEKQVRVVATQLKADDGEDK